MSVIRNVAGAPLFTTIQEALAWATSKGMSGYHIHTFKGSDKGLQDRVGYMGGASHQQTTGMTQSMFGEGETQEEYAKRSKEIERQREMLAKQKKIEKQKSKNDSSSSFSDSGGY